MKHKAPVWRDRANAEVDVAIPDAPGEAERLFLRAESDGQYMVCCLPFGLYGFNLGDKVSIEHRASGVSRLTGVREKSGRYCFRAVLSDGGNKERMASLASTFSSMGCMFEVFSPMMLSVDAEDEQKADWVLAVLQDLQDRESLGELEFETVYSIPIE